MVETTQAAMTQSILTTLRGILITALGGAFGIGWFMAEMSKDIEGIKVGMVELKDNIPPKWVADALSDLEVEQQRLQLQIDRIEDRMNGTAKNGKGTYNGS